MPKQCYDGIGSLCLLVMLPEGDITRIAFVRYDCTVQFVGLIVVTTAQSKPNETVCLNFCYYELHGKIERCRPFTLFHRFIKTTNMNLVLFPLTVNLVITVTIK